jgi:UDP-glucuronate 4-epimerase
MSRILVTGSAGFIGFHLSKKLLESGRQVVGIDNLNQYYSVALKEARNRELQKYPEFRFLKMDMTNREELSNLLQSETFETVYHLAAQAGVRYSLENPAAYLTSNIDATFNLLEIARHLKSAPHLMMASSSSVYGLSKTYPFREDDPADRPVALYGATKRSTELMAHAYSHLFQLRTTMLRFFSVYGPWGRPDVALYHFVDRISHDQEIEVYNHGDMIRDFTYVDDIVDGMIGLAAARLGESQNLHEVFNIGCADPRTLMEFIRSIEASLGKKAKIKFLPDQPGDIYKSFADVSKLKALTGYKPRIKMEEGIERFVKWYKEYEQKK